MKPFRIVLMLALLFVVSGMTFGQMEQPAEEAQPIMTEQLRARVEPGPVVQVGFPASADVFIGPRFAMRIAASAGGYTPMQRAQIIAERMNEAFAEGFSWQDMRVSQVGNEWVVAIDGRLIATADTRSAQAMGVPPGALASMWGTQSVIALGGEPRMIALQLQPVPAAVAGVIEELTVTWAVSPTRTVPLLNMATGQTIGSVVIGGSARTIGVINSVVMDEFSPNGAVVRIFVPVTATQVTDDLTRVPGAGVVGMPVATMPMMDMPMMPNIQAMVAENAAQWNTLINDRMAERDLPLQAQTKVVPLFRTMDMNGDEPPMTPAQQWQAMGAVQVVGSSQGVAQTQAVVATMTDNMLQFRAIGQAAPTAMAEVPAATQALLNEVVVSALIHIGEDMEMPITPTPPDVEPPPMVPPEEPGPPMEPGPPTEPGPPMEPGPPIEPGPPMEPGPPVTPDDLEEDTVPPEETMPMP